MSTVEQVALWAGLISSVISIVLSIFAIAFAILVDRSARQVTQQTIKSLQKIESDVERSSSDTRDLIKAGWDKMLGNVSLPQDAPGGAKDIAAGVAAELRGELKGLVEAGTGRDPGAAEARLDDVLSRLEEALAAQIRTEATPDQPGALIEQARTMLDGLSQEAKALAAEIARVHLSRPQYKEFSKGPLAKAVNELRAAGVIIPVTGIDKAGKDVAAYYFPPRLARALRAALSLSSSPSDAVRDAVKAELKRVGYRRDA